VLLGPSIQTAISRRRWQTTAALAVVVVGLLAAQLPVFDDVRQIRFGRQYATLAIALGIPDERTIAPVYPDPTRAVELGQRAMRDGLTVLSEPRYRELTAELRTRHPTSSLVPCDSDLRLGEGVPGSRFVRLEGRLLPQPGIRPADGPTRILNDRGRIVGFAVVRQPDDDGELAPSPLVGYVLAGAASGPLRFAGANVACADAVSVP
jgi:hypothetical protein